MDKILQALTLLHDMNEKYDLSNENVEAIQVQTANASVCMPLIGKFSSGKSALLNGVLGYEDLLKVNIAPETAVPTEISYAEESRITVVRNDGSEYEVEPEDYEDLKLDASTTRSLRLELANDMLQEIPD